MQSLKILGPMGAVLAALRVNAEIVGVPGFKRDPMRATDAMTAAEAKRQRKMVKRAQETRR